MQQNCCSMISCQTGTTTVEAVVLVLTVAIGFAAAVIPLGSLLSAYHQAVEYMLWMPVP